MKLKLITSPRSPEIPRNIHELKDQILDGTLSPSLLSKLQEKVFQDPDHDPLSAVFNEISMKKQTSKSGYTKLFYGTLSLLLLALGIFIPLLKFRTSKNPTVKLENINSPIPLTVKAHIHVPDLIPEKINFCGELVPVEDKKISKKLKFAFNKEGFSIAQSNRLRRKANKWFPVISPILKKYHIPEDFKYIPLVETGFSNSTSMRGAGGFWQLMSGTARSYGLKVTDSIDERKDVKRCTVAACRYIRDLHNQLGSWTLTAAAYNMGLGGLQNKVDTQNNRDYYHLKLNPETSKYLFKTLAYKKLLGSKKKAPVLNTAG